MLTKHLPELLSLARELEVSWDHKLDALAASGVPLNATNRPRSLQVYDPVLSNLARSYRSHGFIARDLVPTIPVAKLSGQYPVFTKAFWFQQATDNKVQDRSPAREVDFEWSTENYFCDEYALKVSISDLERQQAISELRLEQSKTDLLTQQMELSHEIRVANLLRETGSGLADAALTGGSATPSLTWDNASSAPELDIKTGVIAVYRKTGQRPNVIVFPYEVAYMLAVNTAFRALLRYDAAGSPQNFIQLGDQVLPNVIHGMRVVIPDGAQVDAANEGGTESISEIWGKHVRLLYINPQAQWGQPTTAYLLQHTPKRVTRWQQTDPDVSYVREMERYDLKVVAPDTGYVLTNVIP